MGETPVSKYLMFFNGVVFQHIDGLPSAIVQSQARRRMVASEEEAEALLEEFSIEDYLIPALYEGRILFEYTNGRTALDSPLFVPPPPKLVWPDEEVIDRIVKQSDNEGTFGIINNVEAWVSRANDFRMGNFLTHEDVDDMLELSERNEIGDREIVLAVIEKLKANNPDQ